MSGPEFVAQTDPASLDLGAARDKPTATTPGVREADLSIWAAQGLDVGYWECTPGSFAARRDGYTEICQFLSGSVTVEGPDGTSATLGAGDTLVMPSGWTGVWHVHETVRKLYVTIDDH